MKHYVNLLLGASLLASTSAMAATLPTTGTCGILTTFSVPFGPNASPDGMLNMLGTITFNSATSGTISYAANTIIYNPNPTNNPLGNETVTPGTVTTENFTIGAGTISGSSKLTTASGIVFVVYPVNGGQTLLVQGYNNRAQGVCQF